MNTATVWCDVKHCSNAEEYDGIGQYYCTKEIIGLHNGICKVWALIYELCELDPSDAKPADRLIGAIGKILNTSAAESDPFKWVKERDADKLIETLKGYVKTAERKTKNGHK